MVSKNEETGIFRFYDYFIATTERNDKDFTAVFYDIVAQVKIF